MTVLISIFSPQEWKNTSLKCTWTPIKNTNLVKPMDLDKCIYQFSEGFSMSYISQNDKQTRFLVLWFCLSFLGEWFFSLAYLIYPNYLYTSIKVAVLDRFSCLNFVNNLSFDYLSWVFEVFSKCWNNKPEIWCHKIKSWW